MTIMQIPLKPHLFLRRFLTAICLAITIVSPSPLLLSAKAQAVDAQPTDPMASLVRDPLAEEGKLRCPDGTTRPFSGDRPSDLVVSMACSVSAEVAAERASQASTAVEKKNKEAHLRAALNGDEGVWAGLKASWDTGSPDYLLRFRLTWLIGLGLGVLLIAKIFSKR